MTHQTNQSFQTYQKDDELILNVEKVELIPEKILKNQNIKKIVLNTQDSEIIVLDYFNELIQEIDTNSSIYDLIGFAIGIVIYEIFVFHFYLFLSKRDVFSLNLKKRITQGKFKPTGKKASVAPRIIGFITTNFFIFPFVIFLWFIGY